MVFTTYIESEIIVKSDGSLKYFRVSKTAIASILLLVVFLKPLYNSLTKFPESSYIIELQPPAFIDDL